jgi:uncharacterized integral membrane protein
VRLLYWVVTALVALVLVVFAVSNRATVNLSFWPSATVIEAPLYLFTIVTLFVGFVLGELAAWINGGKRRRETRELRRRVERLDRELSANASPATKVAPIEDR